MNFPKTIVFYDGGCPLCNREIKHYQRLDSAGRIDWIDISRDASLLQAMGVTVETAMARLHVLHRDGWLATGASAFAVVWSELPYYRWLARLVYGLGLLPLLERLYGRFARWRFQRRCQEGFCTVPAAAVKESLPPSR